MSEEERDNMKSPNNPDEILTGESPTVDEASFSETIQCRVDETGNTLEDHKQTKLEEAAKAESTPKNSSPSLAVGTSPVEGSGRRRRHSSSSDSAVVELNRAARSLDHYNLEPGKLIVFQKYFQQPKMKFFVKPEGRRRHKAGDKPQHELHDSTEVKRQLEGETEDPLGYVRSYDPPPQPTLNQAGAVIGYPENKQTMQECLESDTLTGREHSLGSAETVLMHEVYSGKFSPVNPNDGSEALSSGGISNIIKVSSDECSVPSDSLPANVRVSPLISEMDAQQAEKQPRQRRFGLSQPVDIPGRSSGSRISSPGSFPDNFKSVSQQSSLEFEPFVSTYISPAVHARRKISKDSSTDISHRSLSRESSVDLDVYMTENPVTTIDDEIAAQLNEGLLLDESSQPHIVPDLVVIDPSGSAQILSVVSSDVTLETLASAHESSTSALTGRAEIPGLHSSIPTNRNDEDPKPTG